MNEYIQVRSNLVKIQLVLLVVGITTATWSVLQICSYTRSRHILIYVVITPFLVVISFFCHRVYNAITIYHQMLFPEIIHRIETHNSEYAHKQFVQQYTKDNIIYRIILMCLDQHYDRVLYN